MMELNPFDTADMAPFTNALVTCPYCGGKSQYAPSNTFRPFCSRRCKTGDLGKWANEEFTMAADEDSHASEHPKA